MEEWSGLKTKRAVLESILVRYLDEIQRDPKRSIRSLVDLGQVASGHKIQNHFVDLIQQMLTKDDSPYYKMIQNTATLVDHKRLLSFGINFAWNGLTQGTKQIRKQTDKLQCHIPWSLTLRLRQDASSLSQAEYLRLIGEGSKLGICCYFLFPADGESIYLALDLAEQCPDCAFCVVLPEGFDSCRKLISVPVNVILGLDSCSIDWKGCVRLLRQRRMLFFLYRYYRTQEEIQEILSGRWAKRIVPYSGLASLLIFDGSAEMAPQAASIARYAYSTRMAQRYPTLMLDFYHDCLYTDNLVSGAPCFVGLTPEGMGTTVREGLEVPIGQTLRPTDSLVNFLQAATCTP